MFKNAYQVYASLKDLGIISERPYQEHILTCYLQHKLIDN